MRFTENIFKNKISDYRLGEGELNQDILVLNMYLADGLPDELKNIIQFSSAYFQKLYGESINKVEIKLDNRAADMLHLSIEFAKLYKGMKKWYPSGIFKQEMPKYYIQGYHDAESNNENGFKEYRGIYFILKGDYLRTLAKLKDFYNKNAPLYDVIRYPQSTFQDDNFYRRGESPIKRMFFPTDRPEDLDNYEPLLPEEYRRYYKKRYKEGPNLWYISDYVLMINEFDYARDSTFSELKKPTLYINNNSAENMEKYLEKYKSMSMVIEKETRVFCELF